MDTCIALFDTSRAEFHPVKLRVISGFPLSIYCITLLAGGVREILLPTNSRHHNPAHSLVVISGFLPANHQHAQLFIPIRLDSLTLAEFYSNVSYGGDSSHLNIYVSSY